MPDIKLHNTLNDKKEALAPIDDNRVRMYECGPTVYGRQHIGNLRAFVLWDFLRRTLEYAGYEVTQVINITDFGHLESDSDSGEDKMSKGLRREGMEVNVENMKKLGRKYEKLFKDDLDDLHVKSPDHFPRASEQIEDDIALIKKLQEKGFAYETDDGLYFDTSKDSEYGKLVGGIDREDDDAEFGRIDTTHKKHARDFALWKFDEQLGWDSPWGRGFPGWHIECSVMSEKFLEVPFDIHTGGIEHIRIHHTNEIAQTEHAYETKMANFWLHNNHLQIDNTKISKSLGNVVYLDDIRERGYSPMALRYFFLGAHYRSEQNFTWEALDDAARALKRLREHVRNATIDTNTHPDTISSEYKKRFKAKIFDDMNMPEALAIAWQMVRDTNISDTHAAHTLLDFDRVFGLQLAANTTTENPQEIRQLAKERKQARENEAYEKADSLRKEIESHGYSVRDTDNGQEIIPK